MRAGKTRPQRRVQGIQRFGPVEGDQGDVLDGIPSARVDRRELGEDLARVVTYDLRMKAAAEVLGLDVAAPA